MAKKVPVYFAISADVSEVLRGKITSLSGVGVEAVEKSLPRRD